MTKILIIVGLVILSSGCKKHYVCYCTGFGKIDIEDTRKQAEKQCENWHKELSDRAGVPYSDVKCVFEYAGH